MERAYYLKLAADEIFIRRKAPADAKPDPLECELAGALQNACRAMEAQAATSPHKDRFRREALRGYLEAARQLERAAGKTTGDLTQRYVLLQKDIAYRARLLELDQDFWGSSTFGEPGIPAIQLLEMREALLRLETLASEINALQDRSEDKSFQQLQAAAGAAGASGEAQASLPDADKLANARRVAQQRVATANEQLQLSIARQQQVEAQQGRLRAQAEQISNSFAKKLTTAAASYFGVPEDVAKFANGKSLQDNLKDAVRAHAADVLSDPDLLASFGELGQAAASLNAKVQTIKAQYSEQVKSVEDARKFFQKAEAIAEDVRSALRTPTAENLLQIGTRTLARVDSGLSAALTQKACQLVGEAKPVRALLERARQPGAIGARLREEVSKRVPDFAGQELAKRLREFVGQLSVQQKAAWLAATLRKISSLQPVGADADSKVRGEIARAVLRFWPRSVVALLPPAKRDELFKELRSRFRLPTEAELLDRLRTGSLFRLDVTSTQAVLTVEDRSFNLGAFELVLQAADKADAVQVELAKFEDEIEAVLDRLQGEAAIVRSELLRSLPFESVEKAVLDVAMDANAAVEIWDGAVAAVDKGLSCTDPGSVTHPLAEMQVGSLMVGQIADARAAETRYPPDAMGTAVPPPPVGAGSPDNPETELVRQGLAAAFPGYGTAINLAIDMVKGFQQVAGLAKQINDLTAEATRLTQRDIELRATIDASNLALELGVLEGELVQIRRETAKQQFSLLTRAAQAAGGQQQRGLQRIENRLPQFFYLAEQLRSKYDALDRSIALWGPTGGTVRDVIRQLITDDPQNVRLALDNDIHLFAWTERDDERNRTDIDRVLAHWRQLYQLAADVCSNIGCIPGRSRIGHVQQTELIDVCALASAQDCSALQRWLRSPTGTMAIALTIPVDGFVPDHVVNARVIDVRLGGYDKRGQAIPLRNTILTHPGVSFVRTEDAIVRETFGPAQNPSLDWPAAWDLDAVAGRWNTAAQPRRLPLEGYGLQAVWQLRLQPSSGLAALDGNATPADAAPPSDRRSGVFVRFVYNHHIRTQSNDFAAEARSSACRTLVTMAGPARRDYAPIVVTPAMLALAMTKNNPVGRPPSPESIRLAHCDAPATPPVNAEASFSERLVSAPVPGPERARRRDQDAKDLLATCAGRPRGLPERVRFEHVVRTNLSDAYDAVKGAAGPGGRVDPAGMDKVCNALRNDKGTAWWTR